jgi:hypothetical protein
VISTYLERSLPSLLNAAALLPSQRGEVIVILLADDENRWMLGRWTIMVISHALDISLDRIRDVSGYKFQPAATLDLIITAKLNSKTIPRLLPSTKA